jgi:hypothetical protein
MKKLATLVFVVALAACGGKAKNGTTMDKTGAGSAAGSDMAAPAGSDTAAPAGSDTAAPAGSDTAPAGSDTAAPAGSDTGADDSGGGE